MTATLQLPSLFERARFVFVRPDGYLHVAAFDELAVGLTSALLALGIQVDEGINELRKDGINLILGAHLLDPQSVLPQSSIILNFEQLGADSPALYPPYFEQLGRHAVLDYSVRNAELIRSSTGNRHVQILGVGYRPELSRIAVAPEQDVDVLFYGSLDSRRQHVIDELVAAGLKVKTLFGVYAEERDRWIARSKLVLNLHFCEAKIHEVVRSSYLLSNRKAVVCEYDDATEMDQDLRDAMACASYSELVETCVRLARDDQRRHALEQRGFEIFSRRDQAQMLVEALSKLTLPLPRRINLGSGKDWRADALNIDIDVRANPDVVCDLTEPDALARVYLSPRFGLLRLQPGSFDAIESKDVLEHVSDLVGLMTRCLHLLKVGGEMHNSVPYDLSYGAWQDPTHVRAFNERSWLYYTDWHWYIGWREARFDLLRNEMNLSPVGQQLRASGVLDEVIFRTPRAVDSMQVVFKKRLLDSEEKLHAERWYSRSEGHLFKAEEHSSKASEAKREGRPRICLSMIVKNEAHVIERCLRSVLPYIDSWAISDTGSTDGTQDLIRSLLADLPGELIERPWVDFAHNRNEALQLAHKYGEYALAIDADDAFEADPGFQWGELGAPGYMFEIVFGENQSFWRVALMRLGLDWAWEGVIHEIPISSRIEEVMKTKLRGPRIRIIGGGARSQQSLEQKYEKDIEVLQRALRDLPDNPRYTFYLAQGLNERGRLQEAMDVYRRRVQIGGWFEEVYYSKFQIACLKERMGASYAEVVAAYLDVYDYRPQRAEALCELARYLRMNGRHAAAYAFARIACSIPQPDDLVIVDTGVYRWRARDELAIASFSLGDYSACVWLYEEILAASGVPVEERERMRTNLETARMQMGGNSELLEASVA